MKKRSQSNKRSKKNLTTSQDLIQEDKNSRRRNSIKFSELERSDAIDNVNADNTYMIPGNPHYGGDKFSGAVINHTGKNWGFATGIKTQKKNDASFTKNSKKDN